MGDDACLLVWTSLWKKMFFFEFYWRELKVVDFGMDLFLPFVPLLICEKGSLMKSLYDCIDKKERWRQIADPFYARIGTSPASIPHSRVVDPDFIKMKENAYQQRWLVFIF